MASGQMRNPIAASSKVQHQAWPALPALSPAFLFLILPSQPCQAPPTAGSLHKPPWGSVLGGGLRSLWCASLLRVDPVPAPGQPSGHLLKGAPPPPPSVSSQTFPFFQSTRPFAPAFLSLFLSLPHSLCESHGDRAVLLCPGAQHRAWHRAQILSLRKTKPSRRWCLQHAGTPSSLLDFVLRQCVCSLVSDSSRG